MAIDKKSFVAYADWIDSFEELSDEEAGRLVKHMFRYVNDLNPEAPDKLTKMCFIPIKATLKRDLHKYESIRERNAKNGAKGGRPKKSKANPKKAVGLIDNPNEPKKADSVSDSVSDNVSDNEIKEKKKKVFNFRLSLIDLGVEEKVADSWMVVRKAKKAVNTEIAFNGIKAQIEKTNKAPNECIKASVENSWSGFKASWIENLNTTFGSKGQNDSKYTSRTAHVHVRKKENDIDFVDPNNL